MTDIDQHLAKMDEATLRSTLREALRKDRQKTNEINILTKENRELTERLRMVIHSVETALIYLKGTNNGNK